MAVIATWVAAAAAVVLWLLLVAAERSVARVGLKQRAGWLRVAAELEATHPEVPERALASRIRSVAPPLRVRPGYRARGLRRSRAPRAKQSRASLVKIRSTLVAPKRGSVNQR